jgi:2-C-methyl-D-erythritol 4-phosphate cytidylyltransferase
MKIQAIVAAAGSGDRLGGNVPKPFVMIHGRPLVICTLVILEKCPLIESIIVTAHPDHVEWMQKTIHDAGLIKTLHVVAGGETRTRSVRNALDVLDADTEKVLIHDGARPLITVDFIRDMIESSLHEEALIAAVPVKPTIKQVDPDSLIVQKTLDRRCLWDIQTPQIFQRDLLLQAYRQEKGEATDDAALVEYLGKAVKIFPGLEQNIKVTTPYDLLLAEKILEGWDMRAQNN